MPSAFEQRGTQIMFYGTDREYRLNQQRREALIRAAQHQRLVRIALAGRGTGLYFYGPLLATVGRRLIVLGTGLQVRYGSLQQGAHLNDMNSGSLAIDAQTR
jgi:hypothetical protein